MITIPSNLTNSRKRGNNQNKKRRNNQNKREMITIPSNLNSKKT